MATMQQQIIIKEETVKLFVFDEVYSFRAAEEQAEKKKLNAFGMMAKFNPLKRPKEDTVNLSRKESRYEPFWLIEAVKSTNYTSQITYQIPIHNAFAHSIEIDGKTYEVTRNKDKAKIDIVATEASHRKIYFEQYLDGLDRDTKQDYFKSILQKYNYTETNAIEVDNAIEPLVAQQAAIQKACASLNSEAINAHHIDSDEITLEKIHLFFVPVFAFEFVWTAGDKTGVIEVNGLTGEIIENGQWYKDKFNSSLTRDVLIELSSGVADVFIPGGGTAIKIAGRIAEAKHKE